MVRASGLTCFSANAAGGAVDLLPNNSPEVVCQSVNGVAAMLSSSEDPFFRRVIRYVFSSY